MFVTVHEDKHVYILGEQTRTFLIYDVSGATKYTLDRCTGCWYAEQPANADFQSRILTFLFFHHFSRST